LLLEYLEDIPENKVSVRLAGYPLEIVDISESMIKTVRIMPEYYIPPKESNSDSRST